MKFIQAEFLRGRPDFRIRFAREVEAARRVNARFGWLGLPLVLFSGAAAFVLPVETFDVLAYGFAATIVVSRLAALAMRIRAHDTSALAGRALRRATRDVAWAAGLVLIFYGGVVLSVDLLLPAIGPHPGSAYLSALQASGITNPFTSKDQAAYFLHLFLLLSVLVVVAIVVLRTRANLERPLVLPRVAKLLNARPAPIRLAVAGAVIAVTVALIALNGGVSLRQLPSGPICTIGLITCHTAKILAHPAR